MSTKPERPLHLWLPALARFAPDHPLRRLLARADRRADASIGYLDGLGDHFPGAGSPLPAAALTRDYLAGDAAGHGWLSADPAWVQPDINGVRLLACGQLGLSMADAQALAASLKPVFGDAGMLLEITAPDRWHLRLAKDAALPVFAAPEQAMGEDLARHLPQGPQGKRWRVLLNEAQILLHQHPLNAQRRAQGLSPVNSLWLWGGGTLPGPLRSEWAGVISDDVLLRALAARAETAHRSRTAETVATAGKGWLIDLQDLPAGDIATQWWPALQSLLACQPVVLHFASGERWQRKPWHRWRFWRGAGG
jgi:hypothetical protein